MRHLGSEPAHGVAHHYLSISTKTVGEDGGGAKPYFSGGKVGVESLCQINIIYRVGILSRSRRRLAAETDETCS